MPRTRPEPSWLSSSVLYQIYPQTFADSDGDGVGDLAGALEHLDHLAWLGVDAVWFSPLFASPFADAGYDVSDYLSVAPRYGTNEDLVAFVDAARSRGIRVLLDLVAGHTSDQHPWFREWADDPADFVARRKDNWRWTMMIMAPDFITDAMFADAIAKAANKLGEAPGTLRLELYDEGQCLQVLHIGSYDDEGPTLARLHDVEMPQRGLAFNGRHHEIYLSDARRTEPSKLKTILRQPVRPV